MSCGATGPGAYLGPAVPAAKPKGGHGMLNLGTGRYAARLANGGADVAAAQALRHRAFRAATGARASSDSLDRDAFDARCAHVLVEETGSGALVCCFRLLHLPANDIASSYSAQYYDLSALQGFAGSLLEVGRFCIDPDRHDADILRVAWGALTGLVDARGVDLLFGCASFHGTDARAYADSFAMLRDRHLAPSRWRPRTKAPDVIRFAGRHGRAPDLGRALARMPPLLRTYLVMGGWVSDHAVVDREMNTLHVFTGLEVRNVPPGRARLLRRLATDREPGAAMTGFCRT